MTFSADVQLALPPAEPGEERFKLRAATLPNPSGGFGAVDHEIVDDWMTLRAYASGGLALAWRDWLTLWIDPAGRRVDYRVEGTTYPTAFEAYIANFAIAAALLLQGEETLHATVLQLDGIGIGLLGDSGAGKSTMAAYLLGEGAELVTDDMLRITEHGGAAWAEPGQPRLKLFEETARRHFPAGRNNGRWNPVTEKLLFDVGELTEPRERRRLDALVWLGAGAPRDGETVSCRRLNGLELFQTITSSTMNFRLQTRDRLARQFRHAEWVAQRIPVYDLRYPRCHDIFPEACTVLRECLARAG